MKKKELIEMIKSIISEISSCSCGEASTTPGVGEQHSSSKSFKPNKKNINEVSSRDYQKSISATPSQKSRNAYKLVRKKLSEVEHILEFSSRLKEELGGWKLNEQQLSFIQEKIKSINNKAKLLTKK
jgi:hypothetical protein